MKKFVIAMVLCVPAVCLSAAEQKSFPQPTESAVQGMLRALDRDPEARRALQQQYQQIVGTTCGSAMPDLERRCQQYELSDMDRIVCGKVVELMRACRDLPRANLGEKSKFFLSATLCSQPVVRNDSLTAGTECMIEATLRTAREIAAREAGK